MALALLTQMSTPPNRSHGGVDGALHIFFVAHVADHGDALTARGLDLRDGGVHGAGQLGVRFGRLGQQHDVRAAPGARPSAIASPMPRLAPETTRVRSVSDWLTGWTSSLLSTKASP